MLRYFCASLRTPSEIFDVSLCVAVRVINRGKLIERSKANLAKERIKQKKKGPLRRTKQRKIAKKSKEYNKRDLRQRTHTGKKKERRGTNRERVRASVSVSACFVVLLFR